MYSLNGMEEIILYGVNDYTHKYLTLLIQHKFHVCCIMDIRAKEIGKISNINVYSFDDEAVLSMEKDNVFVVILLQDATKHDNIAKKLFACGFNKVLFLPTEYNVQVDNANKMRIMYNYWLQEEYNRLHDIPDVGEIFEDALKARVDSAKREKWITAWVSIELLYTNPEDVFKDKNSSKIRYADIPLVSYEGYIQLFSFMMGYGEEFEAYVEDRGDVICAYKKEISIKYILEQRFKLYSTFQRELNRGIDFFVASAPPCRWNDRGYFNMMEGQHRCIFLYLRGFNRIPVRMKREDYLLWENRSCILPVESFLTEKKIKEIFTPIPHPYFLNYPATRENNSKTVLTILQEYIGTELFFGKSILDISIYNSYFARNAYRMKASNVITFEVEQKKFELAVLMNELLYTSPIQIQRFKTEKNLKEIYYDIVFAMGTIEQYGKEMFEKIIKEISRHEPAKIFWESGKDIDLEKRTMKTILNKYIYKKIKTIFNGQYLCEIGVYLNQESNAEEEM